MSAYAALVSLRLILVRLLYPRPWIIHGRAQLQIILENADLLLDFLDNSSSTYKEEIQTSDLETKIIDAARKAEDLVEHGILDSISIQSQNSIETSISYLSIVIAVSLFSVERYKEVIPFWILFSLTEVAIFTMNTALVYRRMRYLYVFPALNDFQELHRVLYDFEMIVKEVNQIKEARGEAEMSARGEAALLSLRPILDAILEFDDSYHLRSLHEMVSCLLDFLGNASTAYMSTQHLDATITHAVSKAKRALVAFQHPRKFSLHLDFSTLKSLWLDQSILRHLFLTVLIRIIFLAPKEDDSQEMVSLTFIFYLIISVGLYCSISYASSYVPSVVLVHIVLAAKHYSGAPKNQHLPHVIDDFSIIVSDAMNIKDAYGNHPSNLPPPPPAAAAAASSRQDLGGTSKDIVVGLDSDLIQIKARLLQDSSKRELASIIGMGGIGKTTLARQVFKDPCIVTHFDVRAWVTVSQEYSLRHVLLCLLDSADMLRGEQKREDSEDKLTLYLHQYLTSRRYLIVIDDMWDTQIWDFLSRFFPENYNGSRILITSRLPSVASCLASNSPLHRMQCLDENESWDLLRQKAFRDEEASPSDLEDLESIGKEIATSCRGLPLAIVVIGGLLYKEIKIEMWSDVAEKLKKSELQDIMDQCLEILGLSYNHLPHHLRPCFLYMAAFPRDCEIPISRLINLWVAEGILKQRKSKTPEEEAEGYLKDLIDRNLILVCKKSCNGKMRTCSMHDLIRDVCVQNSRKEKFLHVMNSEGKVTTDDESPRRLSIHPDFLHVDADAKLAYVRSLLCIASKSIEYPSGFYLGFVYIRVLDVLEVHFGEFPHQITKLFRLRYLALSYDGPLPPSISELYNLETIVHHCRSFHKYPCLSWVIWRMPNLRHIYVKPGCYLINPIGYYRFLPKVGFLPNLQTLVGIRNFKWSKGIIKRIPNLKKLEISYDVDWSTYQLETLVYLHQLESLKINIKYDGVGSPKLAFPQKLKKLSLSGCRIPWTSMTTAIGALPNLEVLKLRREACVGSSWETVEGEFPKLMFLLLEEMSFTRWETDAAHFPRLQRLVIRSCIMLEGIPCTIGDIPTLEMIELVDCHRCAVASAKEIQLEQESMGNEDLKFHIEQGRRGVDRMDLGNLETRGAYPGRLRVLSDVVRYDFDILIAPVILLVMIVLLLVNIFICVTRFFTQEVQFREV